MSNKKNTFRLNSENRIIFDKIPQTREDVLKIQLHIRNIIESVNNPQDEGVEIFTTDDVNKLADAMTKGEYDVNNTGIVDAANKQEAVVTKDSPGTINPGEAIWLTGDQKGELVDNTFGTGPGIAIALEPITDINQGKVLLTGALRNLDTSLLSLGAIWLSNVPGLLTQTPPVSGEKNQIAGYVVEVHPTEGVIYIGFSDIKNTDADFSIYNPGGNLIITATNVQAALDQVEGAIVGMKFNAYASDEAATASAVNAWVSKIALNVPVLPAGNYEWKWTAEVNCSAVNRMVEVKFEQNASIEGNTDIEPKDPGNWYSVGGFKQFTQAVDGPMNLEIFFRRSGNPAGVSCRRARISIKSL